jgi:hypothetical protein
MRARKWFVLYSRLPSTVAGGLYTWYACRIITQIVTGFHPQGTRARICPYAYVLRFCAYMYTRICIQYNKAPGWANLINSGGFADGGITRDWQEEADEADSNLERTGQYYLNTTLPARNSDRRITREERSRDQKAAS